MSVSTNTVAEHAIKRCLLAYQPSEIFVTLLLGELFGISGA